MRVEQTSTRYPQVGSQGSRTYSIGQHPQVSSRNVALCSMGEPVGTLWVAGHDL